MADFVGRAASAASEAQARRAARPQRAPAAPAPGSAASACASPRASPWAWARLVQHARQKGVSALRAWAGAAKRRCARARAPRGRALSYDSGARCGVLFRERFWRAAGAARQWYAPVRRKKARRRWRAGARAARAQAPQRRGAKRASCGCAEAARRLATRRAEPVGCSQAAVRRRAGGTGRTRDGARKPCAPDGASSEAELRRRAARQRRSCGSLGASGRGALPAQRLAPPASHDPNRAACRAPHRRGRVVGRPRARARESARCAARGVAQGAAFARPATRDHCLGRQSRAGVRDARAGAASAGCGTRLSEGGSACAFLGGMADGSRTRRFQSARQRTAATPKRASARPAGHRAH